jgi:hypothetical protein
MHDCLSDCSAALAAPEAADKRCIIRAWQESPAANRRRGSCLRRGTTARQLWAPQLPAASSVRKFTTGQRAETEVEVHKIGVQQAMRRGEAIQKQDKKCWWPPWQAPLWLCGSCSRCSRTCFQRDKWRQGGLPRQKSLLLGQERSSGRVLCCCRHRRQRLLLTQAVCCRCQPPLPVQLAEQVAQLSGRVVTGTAQMPHQPPVSTIAAGRAGANTASSQCTLCSAFLQAVQRARQSPAPAATQQLATAR